MKKFRTIIIEAGIILLGVLAVGFFVALARQQNVAEYTQGKLKRENRNLEIQVQRHDCLFGKYIDEVSDSMLHDFYPQATDIDSLRSHLREKYEIRLRTETDGLCY